MNKSKMKEIRRQVRSADLSNKEEEIEHSKHYYDTERNKENDTAQLNKISDLVEELKSTQPHCIGPDGVEHNQEKDLQVEACMEEKYSKGRREVLNELWTSDKILKDGYWFVKLTDVIKIIDNYRN